jgi:hypothetical protein
VVTHSSFLRHLFGQFGGSLVETDKKRLQGLASNCELRSIVMCSHGSKEHTGQRTMLAQERPPSTWTVPRQGPASPTKEFDDDSSDGNASPIARHQPGQFAKNVLMSKQSTENLAAIQIPE